LIEEAELSRVLNLYPVLHDLPAALQHSFYNSSYAVHLPVGEVIFDAGRYIPFFFFLTSGSVRVSRLGSEREILLYRLQPGEICILSVCCLLTDMQYQAIASTEQPMTSIIVPRALFAQFVESSPLFCSYLFHSFSAHLAVLVELLEAVSFSHLDKRLAGLLLSSGGTIQATHSQLADDLGSVREVISRILKEFERKGLVKLERNKISIINAPSLKKIAMGFDDSCAD
jgi:CRP/FNR family transcriptional regulator